MKLSQENRYVIDCFNKILQKNPEKKAVIYGIGDNTQIILSEIGKTQVAGLMDAAFEGKQVLGLSVFSLEDAVKFGDYVVIVARSSVVPIIFERIKALEELYHFPVYNLEGERLIEKKAPIYRNENSYWEKKEDDLFRQISSHDTISFDIFDTLIMRDCMLPTDIFLMVELKLQERNIPCEGFYSARREAEIELEKGYPILQELYDYVQERLHWTDAEKDEAMQWELCLEETHCKPRAFMKSVYEKAAAMGKQVILVSDMYLPRQEIIKLLRQCGILQYDQIYISCEEKADKKTGGLFRKILKDGYQNILHIGDNERSDGKAAEEQGIHSYTIWSAYEMLVQSSMRYMLSFADSLEKRNCVGKIIAQVFDQPFFLNEKRGKFQVQTPYDIGYLFLGPVIRCFLSFLKDTVKKLQVDKVLFCARDGYVIWRLYKMFQEYQTGYFPEGIYFKTSRRAITVAAIQNESDIAVILQKPYRTTMGELLHTRFGILPDPKDAMAGYMAVSTENPDEVNAYIMSYYNKILQNAKEEWKSYQTYLDRNHILEGQKFAVYDFCSGGTIQHYLEKLHPAEYRGVYFATVNLPNIFYPNGDKMNTLFGNIGQYETRYHLAKHYMYLEGVLTDENGTLVRFDPEGVPLYDESENSRRCLDGILEIQRGIEAFCQETVSCSWFDDYETMKIFSDKLLGCLFKQEVCEIPHPIKTIVKAESAYDFLDAYTAWNGE